MKWQDFINIINETDLPKLEKTEDIKEFLRIAKDVIILLNLAIVFAEKQNELDECTKEIKPILNELGYRIQEISR